MLPPLRGAQHHHEDPSDSERPNFFLAQVAEATYLVELEVVMKIIGRTKYEGTNALATTHVVAKEEHKFYGIATGTEIVAEATLSESDKKTNEGGYVLTLALPKAVYDFIPHVEVTEDGVEIHLGGQQEASAMMAALKSLLDKVKIKKTRPCDEDIPPPKFGYLAPDENMAIKRNAAQEAVALYQKRTGCPQEYAVAAVQEMLQIFMRAQAASRRTMS